jgi:hypothetical protein
LPAPPSWRVTRIPTGAELFYPRSWQLARGDRGTATSVLLSTSRRIVGYLNLTPRQSTETLSDWARFRVAHNLQEGERNVVSEETRSAVPFRNATGTCLKDSYTTASASRYIEIACLVDGRTASSVVVGAAVPSAWPALAPQLERAIAALIT